jgi:transposase
MGAPVKVTRDEHTAQELRRIASDMKDAGQARRVQAISLVMDGWSRARAAAFACVDRQTLRDWVERYNEWGVDGLATLTSPGRPRSAEPLRYIILRASRSRLRWPNSPLFSLRARCSGGPHQKARNAVHRISRIMRGLSLCGFRPCLAGKSRSITLKYLDVKGR